MAIVQYPSPLPAGCHSEIISHCTFGRFVVVVFPNGEIVDYFSAPFWRYNEHLYKEYGHGPH